MLQNFVRSLCRNPGGVILVAGAIGVLAGVEHFMSARAVAPAGASRRRPVRRLPRSSGVDRFSIRRTKSELGYCYWVLQGYGKYTGFDLFDTWQEAMDEVQHRTGSLSPAEEPAQAVSVGA